jgi:putative ABC transport system permease protein
MDEKVQSMYQSELQLKKAAGIATGLMLLIVLLGIFGVLTLALTRRTKEIAIRKVLGADLNHILSLFINQYAGLLLISNLIAWPLAYYFGNQWLQQYAYRIIQPKGLLRVFRSGNSVCFISWQCRAALANGSSLHAE